MNNKVEISLENGTVIEIDNREKSKEDAGIIVEGAIAAAIMISGGVLIAKEKLEKKKR